MWKVVHNGVSISCRQAGRRLPGRAALMIHGLAANIAFWHPSLIQQLGQRRSLVMYDLRGHGFSDMPASAYTSYDMAADALAVLDALEIDQCDLIAHSFGASVAMQVALYFPERVASLTVLDARIRALQPIQRLQDWPHAERWTSHFSTAGISIDEDQELDFLLPMLLDDAGWDQLRAQLEADGFAAPAGGRRGLAKYRKLMAETTARDDFHNSAGLDAEVIQTIDVPTLVIYGSCSPYLPTRDALAALLPNRELAVVDGAGHNFPRLRPAETAHLVEEFWNASVAIPTA